MTEYVVLKNSNASEWKRQVTTNYLHEYALNWKIEEKEIAVLFALKINQDITTINEIIFSPQFDNFFETYDYSNLF